MTYREFYYQSLKEAEKTDREPSGIKWLFLAVTQKSFADFVLSWHEPIPDTEFKILNELIGKYLYELQPIQYLLGKTTFYGLDLILSPAVLIPRFETEELVERIIHWIEKSGNNNLRLVDLGTGSGAIALAVKKTCPDVSVIATDLSEKALEIARKNAEKHHLAVDFLQGNWLEPLIDKNEKVNVIVSNPPYIPEQGPVNEDVLQIEPALALFAGEDGLAAYRAILKDAKKVLLYPGLIAFEHGFDQAEEIKKIAQAYFLNSVVSTYCDMQGKPRITWIEIGSE
jgi:release factor glutamine methyltransferase